MSRFELGSPVQHEIALQPNVSKELLSTKHAVFTQSLSSSADNILSFALLSPTSSKIESMQTLLMVSEITMKSVLVPSHIFVNKSQTFDSSNVNRERLSVAAHRSVDVNESLKQTPMVTTESFLVIDSSSIETPTETGLESSLIFASENQATQIIVVNETEPLYSSATPHLDSSSSKIIVQTKSALIIQTSVIDSERENVVLVEASMTFANISTVLNEVLPSMVAEIKSEPVSDNLETSVNKTNDARANRMQIFVKDRHLEEDKKTTQSRPTLTTPTDETKNTTMMPTLHQQGIVCINAIIIFRYLNLD